MPARFVYWMNTSLDLFIERTPGEQGGGDWLRIDEPLHREFNRRAAAMTTMVEGRVIYETMESYWPAARTDESASPVMREYGEIWTSAPKLLVSRTRTDAQYNTRIIGGDDAIRQLAAIRAESDGDIGVGGATLATQLLDAGILDELLLFQHPVIIGAGRPLFDGGPRTIQLDLLEQQGFGNGVVMHRYAVRHD
ncbi:deaminase [Planctomonas sp. JC2975]|uniref:dihydrofolate reductase family protein n=1 Tax=Planctomonas sp. JC2975 TaxID=2729626 RepID=UPI0014737C6B|nr:dihydrofolate reductase family protein [Planctomonas sp. JC2975]NNC13988.1 deaminase [Planctomonas sp. JC2975]